MTNLWQIAMNITNIVHEFFCLWPVWAIWLWLGVLVIAIVSLVVLHKIRRPGPCDWTKVVIAVVLISALPSWYFLVGVFAILLFMRRLLPREQWEIRSAAILVIIVMATSYKYEEIKSNFPWLISLQLKGYQLYPWSRQPPTLVVPVEIDDATFYGYMENEGAFDDMTERDALAKLVAIAAHKGAKVIALDINLDATRNELDATRNEGSLSEKCDPSWEAKEAEPRNKRDLNADNKDLKNAIRCAIQNEKPPVPVVLVFGFQGNGQPVPSAFFSAENLTLPEGWQQEPRVGFDHAPDDIRKVPLEVGAKCPRAGGKDSEAGLDRFPSFALQIVDAYEKEKPESDKKKISLTSQLEDLDFVYTSYSKRSAFQCVSAGDILCPDVKDLEEKAKCKTFHVYKKELRGFYEKTKHDKESETPCDTVEPELKDKIVLIGGNRHQDRPDFENDLKDLLDLKIADDHDSPVGKLRGMYFHANYVQGLLDHRILSTVPGSIAAIFDGALAIFFMVCFEHKVAAYSTCWRVAIPFLVFPLGIFVLACSAGFLMHRVVDFVLPLVLLFLHPAIKSYPGWFRKIRLGKHWVRQ
jgi:CHASE2 domain